MMWTEMAILRKNGNAENKSIATEMKIVFDGLISILYMWLRERVSELENVSVGTSKTENKEEEKKKNRKQPPGNYRVVYTKLSRYTEGKTGE